jgi:hypothetical protein
MRGGTRDRESEIAYCTWPTSLQRRRIPWKWIGGSRLQGSLFLVGLTWEPGGISPGSPGASALMPCNFSLGGEDGVTGGSLAGDVPSTSLYAPTTCSTRDHPSTNLKLDGYRNSKEQKRTGLLRSRSLPVPPRPHHDPRTLSWSEQEWYVPR